MEILESILSQQIVEKLGWTLIHFVWQGAAVAILAAVVLKLLRKASSNLRYVVACMALVVIVILPVVTFQMIEIASLSRSGTPRNDSWRGNDSYEMTANNDIKQEMATVENAIPVQAAALPAIPLKERVVGVIEPILPYAVLGWLVGVAGLSLWYLGGWTQLQRLRRRMVKPVCGDVKSKLKQLSQKLGIGGAVVLVESAIVNVPTVIGYFRPMILLPATAMTGLSGGQIEAILAHELAHIKRCDYLVNILQTVVEILGFYHPAVWWISNKIRYERENCCDDIAVKITGDNINYAQALATMEEIRFGGQQLAVAASGGNLFNRICRLLGKDSANNEKANWIPSVVAIVLIGLMIVSAVMAVTKTEEPQRHPASSATTPRQAEDTEKQKAEKQGDFKAVLPNGTMIELIGVCEHPSKGKQWWRPDGSLLEQRPWDKINGSVSDGFGTNTYEFAFKLNYPAENNPGWYITFENSGSMSSGTFDSGTTNLTSWFAVALPSDIKQTSLTASLAIGKWKDRFSRKVSSGTGVFVETENTQGIAWLSPVESNNKTSIAVSHSFRDLQTRLIAIDKDDIEHIGSASSGTFGNNSNVTMQTSFDLPLKEIKEFKLQTRPYEKYVFKNVSLMPNFKTDVQIGTKKNIATENTEDTEGKKEKLQNLVEDFFKHNYHDITARKTIEWGKPIIDADGNMSIRYKYEAAIRGKDKIITNQLFVFDKDGKVISFNKIEDDIKITPLNFDELLSKNVTVDIDKSPDGSGLTVQYAVIAVCEAAGVPYKWDKSAKLAEPQRLIFIKPLHIKDKIACNAIADILKPFGLNYAMDSDGLFIYKN